MSSRPLRFTIPPVIALAILAAACTGSSNDGTGGGGSPATSSASSATESPTFSGHGVSFSYPTDWQQLRGADTSASTGSQVWSETFGIDGRNIVIVAQYSLAVSITDQNIDARAEGIRAQLDSLFAQAGGSLTSGPTTEEMGGLPALSFVGTAKNPSGDAVESRLVLAFDGTTEYFVNCQYDDGGRDAIVAGCDRIVSTFAVAG